MSKNLVIVESPAKAKTIEGYLGKDFIVRSSNGHIRDLSKKGLSVDIGNGFLPAYEISADKKQLVADLKKIASKVETVWLATDEDREGEAISWHLLETLGLDIHQTKRITFNEITKSAILKSIDNPRLIDKDLVDAQQARRILDRIVGFELSPVLWKKVKPSLSAGRVQSVAVRLIVEREKEIASFEATTFFKLTATFGAAKGSLKAELEDHMQSPEEVKAFLNGLPGCDFSVESVEVKPHNRFPAAPFTTSTLQQEASVKLGFSVSRTMSVAQKLYEGGFITYMRTDSTNLSQTALDQAKDEILRSYGSEYSKTTQYATKNAGAQEAHEAIRPTKFSAVDVSSNREEQRLYDLIRKRCLASQMTAAKFEKTTLKIKGAPQDKRFIARGEVVLFDGFLKVYNVADEEENSDNEDETGLLPKVDKEESLHFIELTAAQRYTRGPARFSEASLVKKMEELGIGRPSTYAPTISTVQKRGYVAKNDRPPLERQLTKMHLSSKGLVESVHTETTGSDKNRLIPTDIGVLVTEFLEEQFQQIMDYQFTAQVEASFDEIAQGKMHWTSMLDSFYNSFHGKVQNTLDQSARVTGERELGIDPTSKRKVIVRMGRFGPVAQIGNEQEEGVKAQYASLQKNQSIQSITLEEALELFKLPRIVGERGGEVIKANIGKFGPYVQLGKTYASIPKEEDVMEITLERALELIDLKVQGAANNTIVSFEERPDVLVLNGKYGPYIKVGKLNVKIPKGTEPTSLTLEDCLNLSENQPKSSAKRSGSRKKA